MNLDDDDVVVEKVARIEYQNMNGKYILLIEEQFNSLHI